jgi:predicted DCC family thiol-disulfide oxidoreductase YuxK
MDIIQYNKVGNTPISNLVVWDGNCAFCRYWMVRFRNFTGGRVSDAPFQIAAAKFQEIQEEEFRESVKLIDPAGNVYSGAAAAIKALETTERFSYLWKLYVKNYLFRIACDLVYKLVSRNRPMAYRITKMLWGKDPAHPRHYWILYIAALTILIVLKRKSSFISRLSPRISKSK